MEFDVGREQKKNLERFARDDFHLAAEFAKRIVKEGQDFIKAVVLFGSAARKDRKANDVDVLVLVDDVSLQLTKETYRLIVQKVIADVSVRLHVTTLRFTSFWEYLRVGDPIALNMLRDGYALIDANFFVPMQRLLQQGRIRPTPEAVYTYANKSSMTLANCTWHLLQATVDLYWAAVDAAQAALMAVGELPASPEHVADLLDQRLVKVGLLDASMPEVMQRLYVLQKQIVHGEVHEITGAQFDAYLRQTKAFVESMKQVIERK
jgi:predicted nucleotidyltransferase/uncharacterized protein (UPF0332 family)